MSHQLQFGDRFQGIGKIASTGRIQTLPGLLLGYVFK